MRRTNWSSERPRSYPLPKDLRGDLRGDQFEGETEIPIAPRAEMSNEDQPEKPGHGGRDRPRGGWACCARGAALGGAIVGLARHRASGEEPALVDVRQ
jgi:hypothetical protein